MGERKVLNKYYPPDFDPAKLPRRKRLKNEQMKVRMMLPMSIRCATCGEYMSKGTKFNSRKEDVPEEAYLGLMVFRFYIKCQRCAAEMTFKTDPQNNDYIVENGATRNYEPWREKDQAVADATKKREEEEAGNAMKVLENKTYDSKVEMDILAALDEMKSIRSRQATVDTDSMLEALKRTQQDRERELDEEDEKLIRTVFQNGGGNFVRRIEDEEAPTEPNRTPGGGAKRRREADPLVTTAAAAEMQADVAPEANAAPDGAAPGPSAPPKTSGGTGPSFAFRPKAVTFVAKPRAAGAAPRLQARGNSTSNGSSIQSTAAGVGPPPPSGSGAATGLSSLAAAYSDSEED
ncbi:hypothetical protein KFL_002280030 [Klebsormidium nitens]|uniref:Splicing factor YJU2 n=1 Tax=Klebsormidium nitens TaxID=105231 RepID=A0A1Y1I786_KLENI|nr:hypothetical protein KFL_002280030 [Klebsormidium nitens]|eukprot:GAQ85289.1 hypothetical protein KFL_002280030 [Klebsormidium nitens]